MTARSLTTRLVVALLGVGLVIGGSPPAALAQETDLRSAVSATFALDPGAAEVRARFSYEFVNAASGIAFPGFFESIPAEATDLSAAADGESLAVAAVGEADGYTVWSVDFGGDLEPGEAVDVTLDFTLGPSAGVVVEPGAVAFEAFAPGDPQAGEIALRLVAPAGFELRGGSGDATLVEGFGDLALADVVAPAAYEAVRVVATDRARFTEVEREADGVILADYAADGAWSAEIGPALDDVADELEAWFGPSTESVEIRRAVPDTALDAGDSVAAVPPYVELDATDPAEVRRVAARARLVSVPSDEPWLAEGFAAAFAGVEPATPAAIVVADLADEMGPSGVRAVVDALRDGSISYPGVGEEPHPRPPDWRTLLDLFEGVGGVDDAAAPFLGSVADAEGADEIARRATARVDYTALEDRASPWALPPMLRVPMAAWDFDVFGDRQGAVSATIATRDGLAVWAEELGLDLGDAAREAFETATDSMAATDTVLAEQTDALEAFDEAEGLVNGDRGLLARIGLVGRDPDGGLAGLRTSWDEGDFAAVVSGGHGLTDEVEGAVSRGTLRIVLPVILLLAGWQGLRSLRRRGPRVIQAGAENQPA